MQYIKENLISFEFYSKTYLIAEYLLRNGFKNTGNQVRFRVILKDFLSLIVTYNEGEYTLDTNVFPHIKGKVNLLKHNKLKFVKKVERDNGNIFSNYKRKSNLRNKYLATNYLIGARSSKINFEDSNDIIFEDGTPECWLMYSS